MARKTLQELSDERVKLKLALGENRLFKHKRTGNYYVVLDVVLGIEEMWAYTYCSVGDPSVPFVRGVEDFKEKFIPWVPAA